MKPFELNLCWKLCFYSAQPSLFSSTWRITSSQRVYVSILWYYQSDRSLNAEITRGSVDSEGSISLKEEIITNLRGTLCLLPKFEYTYSIAPSLPPIYIFDGIEKQSKWREKSLMILLRAFQPSLKKTLSPLRNQLLNFETPCNGPKSPSEFKIGLTSGIFRWYYDLN